MKLVDRWNLPLDPDDLPIRIPRDPNDIDEDEDESEQEEE